MKQRKIFCLNNISELGLNKFKDNYEIVKAKENSHGILVRSQDMKEYDFPSTLRAIARAGVGVNNIPIEECSKRGIVVFNTPGANANAVKELVIAGLLLASRDILGGIDFVKRNANNENIAQIVEKEKKAFAGQEIFDKTIGVIGLGAIGCEVANACNELGMKVLGYDPFLSVKTAWKLDKHVQLIENEDVLFANCDYITLHIPYMKETKWVINKNSFDKMKDGVKIINFARDMLVNENDLKEALISKKVSKYVSDFPNPLICSLENVIIIPHLGASTKEAEDNCAMMAVSEIMDYLDNGNIKNSVNFPEINCGTCTSSSRIALLHQNIPNMLGQITALLGEGHVNIDNLTNKSNGDYAYTILDIEERIDENTLNKLKQYKGIIRVRVIK
ncbi:MAG: phosphoglycerate dehydrogenase [Eubacteriales bacterium]|nr:phosphoglycerate dehydrogenase [Eubacteriales bacterium]